MGSRSSSAAVQRESGRRGEGGELLIPPPFDSRFLVLLEVTEFILTGCVEILFVNFVVLLLQFGKTETQQALKSGPNPITLMEGVRVCFYLFVFCFFFFF